MVNVPVVFQNDYTVLDIDDQGSLTLIDQDGHTVVIKITQALRLL